MKKLTAFLLALFLAVPAASQAAGQENAPRYGLFRRAGRIPEHTP